MENARGPLAPGPLPAPLAALADESERPVIVRTRGLTKAYDGKLALDNLDLEIREGEIFGYIGPNGAGKTTTIRILCGLLKQTSGQAFIDGVEVN